MEIIRYIERSVAGQASHLDGLGGRGAPVGGSHNTYPGQLPDSLARYYDVQRALSLLETSAGRPPDAVTLALMVRDRLEGYSFSAIDRRMRQKRRRRLRGGGLWSKDGVRRNLDRAYTWLCHPAFGAVLTWEEWRRCLACDKQDKVCRYCPARS